MDESKLVLDAIHDRLSHEPVSLVSPMTDEGDALHLLAGRLVLEVRVQYDEGAHPAIAHAHVLATIEGQEPLDASVVAVDPDRAKGLAGVGHTFCDLVAGPILSLVHARPVMGAVHFDGRDGRGVAGHHGFLGPQMVRGLPPGEPDPFEGISAFDFADALAPPRLAHLAKAVFDIRQDGHIRRNLEVDGHVSHVDALWAPDHKGPANTFGVRFAVFHAADQPDSVRHNRAIDEAILAFIEHFAATRDRDAAADHLASSGTDRRLVHELRLFVPAAFARLVFGDRLPLSTTFTRVRADGWTDENLLFMAERSFARAKVLGTERMERGDVALANELALASSEVGAMNHALQNGTALEDLAPLAPLIPDPNVSIEVLERVARRLYGG